MKREKSLWILVIIALLFLVVWNLRLHAEPGAVRGSARRTLCLPPPVAAASDRLGVRRPDGRVRRPQLRDCHAEWLRIERP